MEETFRPWSCQADTSSPGKRYRVHSSGPHIASIAHYVISLDASLLQQSGFWAIHCVLAREVSTFGAPIGRRPTAWSDSFSFIKCVGIVSQPLRQCVSFVWAAEWSRACQPTAYPGSCNVPSELPADLDALSFPVRTALASCRPLLQHHSGPAFPARETKISLCLVAACLVFKHTAWGHCPLAT